MYLPILFYTPDEAHKYRNKNTNRWKNVRKLQKKEDGFPNKFLLLTATPLNNSISDIFNLIRLFVDDTFAPFRIKGVPITELIKKYNELRQELQKRDDDKNKKDLKAVATEIKQKILDEIMILRTRKYITEQLKEIKVNGKPLIFKDPKPYGLDYSPFYTKGYKSLIKAISDNLNRILFEYTKLYGTRFVVFEEESIDDKEPVKKLIEVADLFKLLLGKRLESGIYPFEATLKRIYEKERIFYQILRTEMDSILKKEDLRDLIKSAVEKAKTGKELEEISEEYNIEKEDEETWFDKVVRILFDYAEELKEEEEEYSEIDLLKLGLRKALGNLESDLRLMDNIFSELDKLKEKENGEYKTLGRIPKEREDIIDLPIYSYINDPKLESLKQIIGNPSFKSQELKDIPSLNNKKIIIFTQYKDTAYYLYHHLRDWVKKETDLHIWLKDKWDRIKIGLVIGDTETPTKINYIKRFAPQANNGFEEVDKFGEVEILISTDALSEGVNLQDGDAVINYDLPWNPMVIVQRVGRVNRIGNEKDVYVINYIPSDEIEVIVGVLRKLKEKIQDITLIVGKDVRILSPEEEINIETFGEKIKDISRLSMTDLEQYGVSEDFKQFIPEGIPQEQLDEYKLLNIIQYELGYSHEDFKEIIKMKDGPYYSFIEGEDKVMSVYEFYRGRYKIMKKIMSISRDGEVRYETPLSFLDLIKKKEKFPQKIEKAIENLKKMKEEVEKIVEKLKEEYQQEQKGFLAELRKSLLRERRKLKPGEESKFWNCVNVIQLLPHHIHSGLLKECLLRDDLIEIVKNSEVKIKDISGTIHKIEEYLIQQNITTIVSLSPEVKHLGWYYEI